MSEVEIPSKLFIGELEFDCIVVVIGDETGATGISRVLLDDEDMFLTPSQMDEVEELFLSKFKIGDIHG